MHILIYSASFAFSAVKYYWILWALCGHIPLCLLFSNVAFFLVTFALWLVLLCLVHFFSLCASCAFLWPIKSVQSWSQNIVYSISIYAYTYILCILCVLCVEFFVVFSNGANPRNLWNPWLNIIEFSTFSAFSAVNSFYSFFLLTFVWKYVKIPVCLPAGKR